MATQRESHGSISHRAYTVVSNASSWEELWEAGSYYQRVSDLIENAERYIIVVGWQIDSRVRLSQGRETLQQKFIRLCEANPELNIYLLLWDHAYFYCLERENMQGRIWDEIHPRIHFVFDNRHAIGAAHHEKLIIIDGRVALCGGIDLCDERWDSRNHYYQDPRRSLDWRHEHHGPYHDIAVQVTGPVCAELQAHAAERWKLHTSMPFPEIPKTLSQGQIHGGHRVYVSRTMSKKSPVSPILREVEFMVGGLVERAEKRIIIEGQYFWSRRFADLLIAKIRRMKGKDFEVHLILADLNRLKSLTKQMAAHELELLAKLKSAATECGTRLSMGTPYALPENSGHNSSPRPVYVHSKLLIIDDRYMCIGSANLSSRAFRLDTELNLTFEAETPSERRYLARLAQSILNHWNGTEHSHLHIRPYRPEQELRRLRSAHPWSSRFPWKAFFDPELPWFYPVNRVIRRIQRNHPWTLNALAFVICAGMTALATAITIKTSPESPQLLWVTAYAAVLASSWLIPVPFMLMGLVAAAHLGPGVGPRLTTVSFWTLASWCYVLGRALPHLCLYRLMSLTSARIQKPLQSRKFGDLLRTLVDPRIGIRDKLLGQGVHRVYFPWFVVGTWIFLGSAIHVLCEGIAWLARSQ